MVTVEIGAKYRLGYETGELGVSRGIRVRVSRREGFWGLRRLDQKCVWCGKGYLGLCVCWKKASTGVCVCAGRRRAEGLLATLEKLERWSGAGEKFSKTKNVCAGVWGVGKWLWLHALVREMTFLNANLIFQLKNKKLKSKCCCHVRWSWKW